MPYTQNAGQLPYWLTQGEENVDLTQLPKVDAFGAQLAPAPVPAQAPMLGGPSSAPPGGLADAIGNGLPAGMNMEPAKTPEEKAVRKQGWLQALGNVFADPKSGDTLMRIGLQMMQPIPRGQTAGGHTAKSIMEGMDYGTQRNVAEVKGLREGKESTSKIGLQDATADFYRRNKGKVAGAGGGGTASEVQKVNQLAAALRLKNPDYYNDNPGQDIIDAREAIDSVKREGIAAGLARAQIVPGTDTAATVAASVEQAKKLREAGTTRGAETKGKVPEGAKTGMDKTTGRKVYTTDGGVTFYDMETGKKVQ